MFQLLKPYAELGRIEVGCDEVGRGALAGPVVAAAVVLPANFADAVDLQDSKRLTAKKRTQVAPRIRSAALGCAIGLASVEEIEHLNVLHASVLAMHRALSRLSIAFQHILVDGTFFRPYASVPHTCVKRGDQTYQSIAAASIVAKVHRDHLMQALSISYPAYHWDKNKGYGTAAHRRALQDFLPVPHHRKTFAPCISSSVA